MRIAILTTARSGSTSLFHFLEDHLDPKVYTTVSEPFNKPWRDKAGLKTYDTNFFEGKDNILIKTFINNNQIPESFSNNEEGFWKWFFDYFDRVILLDRQDKELQSESLIYHMKKNDIHSWQRKQCYDLSKISEEEITNTKTVLFENQKKIYDLSNEGHPLYFFEDIFIKKDKSIVEKMCQDIDIKLDDEIYEKYIGSDAFKIRLYPSKNPFNKLM